MKKLLILTPLLMLLAMMFGTVGTAGVAYADEPTTNCTGTTDINTDPKNGATVVPKNRQCDPALNGECADVNHCDIISKYVNPLIYFVTALVGVAIVGAIIFGGIQYASSGGDPQKAASGKNHIKNAIIALVVFLFLGTFLEFLVPGGLVK